VRDDVDVMREAIALARGARRHTAPWPAVGCVIVRNGEIVGRGATGPFPKGPHAEVAALRDAGTRANGATAFTTLEPCDHHGNTPPCTEALIDAGIRTVVVAVDDPDEKVAGRGYARLRAAGIEVIDGLARAEAERDLAPYLHHRRTGRAFVVAKLAMSLDGRIAAADGSSQWITSEAARANAHELRADSQAIIVGAGTALADNPALTVRDVSNPPAHPPLRVLLDAKGRVPAVGPLFDDVAPTLVVTTDHAAPGAVDAWRAAGAKVEPVPASAEGVDLEAVLALLGREHVLQALVEGGATLHGALLRADLVDRVVAYVAPVLLGTRGAPGFTFDGPATIGDAERFTLLGTHQLGPDVRLDYEVTH
jgi:diaminohydroxyphosphoribosylaminopyrimidine deaminase/5-amino-6-(5-phosphoribosylamino)uracil reductase